MASSARGPPRAAHPMGVAWLWSGVSGARAVELASSPSRSRPDYTPSGGREHRRDVGTHRAEHEFAAHGRRRLGAPAGPQGGHVLPLATPTADAGTRCGCSAPTCPRCWPRWDAVGSPCSSRQCRRRRGPRRKRWPRLVARATPNPSRNCRCPLADYPPQRSRRNKSARVLPR
jgi:hypothetical protein